MALWDGCSFVNSLHIFRTSFLKNTYGSLLLTKWETKANLSQLLCPKLETIKLCYRGK